MVYKEWLDQNLDFNALLERVRDIDRLNRIWDLLNAPLGVSKRKLVELPDAGESYVYKALDVGVLSDFVQDKLVRDEFIVSSHPLAVESVLENKLKPLAIGKSARGEVLQDAFIPVLEKERVVPFFDYSSGFGKIISDSAKQEGWQVTTFDEQGPRGDMIFEDPKKAFDAVLRSTRDYEIIAQDVADQLLL